MRILITAGPTREFIDPIRFISNSSTGFLGYEIARIAAARGHKVILVSGPTDLMPPKKVKFIPVLSALEMRSAVKRFYPSVDCLIMSAAVADYRPAKIAGRKIKKAKERLAIRLKKNPDILLEAGKKKGNRILVGFSLETGDPVSDARRKLKRKNLDLIVASSLRGGNDPFGDKKARFVIIDRAGSVDNAVCSKRMLSNIIIDKAESIH